MEINREKSLFDKIATDTLFITGAAVVMYFLGMIYYASLAEFFQFEVGLFTIPVNEVMMVPWDNALVAFGVGLTVWLFWRLREFIVAVIASVLVVTMRLTEPLLIRLIKSTWISRLLARLPRLKADEPSKPVSKLPPWLFEARDKVNEQEIAMVMVYLCFGIALLLVAKNMQDKAMSRVSQYEKSTDKESVELICHNVETITGYYVCCIGDGIIVERHDEGPPKRIMVRTSEVKKFTKYLRSKSDNPLVPKPSAQVPAMPPPVP